MRLRRIVLILTAFVSALALRAQGERIVRHGELKTPSIVFFSESSYPAFESWPQTMLKLSGQSEKTSWKIYRQLDDDLGQTHYRIQQYYNHIPVELATFILHTKAQKIISANGEIMPEKNLGGEIKLTGEEAFQKALLFLPAEVYHWQDAAQNAVLQHATGKADTTWFPKPELVYVPLDLRISNACKLAYKFNIYASVPLIAKAVYIDASDGSVIASQELIHHTEVTGSAVTKYSGTRTIRTDSTSPGNYRLREAGRGNGIETYNMKKGTSYAASVDFTDADNNWNNVNANKDEYATDAHWGAEMTYDYYKSVHGRLSYDGNNAKILSYVHYSSNYNNAFWNGVCMTYGDGDGTTFTPLISLDVCGHEITHAVTTNSAGLVYSYESGALNESFSDIFGNSIERWAKPTKWSWKIGEEITPSGNGLRNMTNPNIFSNPKFYKGNYWYSGAGDNGGVHYNSGVQNYWYYLIASGSTGTNEKGWAFKIDSLGIDAAAKIAYRNLTVYLTTNSQYADARTFSIMSATDLFGACSKEVINVTNAWWVCGVGNKYDSAAVKADFRADTLVCFTNKSVSFSNLSDNYKSVKWYFGDGNTSTAINPTYAYGTYGQFSVKLVATSCFKNKYDSITRVNYVKVDSTADICDAILMPKNGTDSASNRCSGFIYDDGGEGNYKALIQTNLKVIIPAADSIRFRFLVLDYENGYDSVVLFKNTTSQANKLGRFTGNTLPFGGTWQTVKAGALWLKHYSDPLVEGKGFKIQFEGIRKPIVVNLGNDTTICLGDSVTINPIISGGYKPSFSYAWNNQKGTTMLGVRPKTGGTYVLKVTDLCTGKSATDSMRILLRPALDVKLGNDTIICAGRSVTLNAKAKGGLISSYSYSWNNGLSGLALHLVTPATTTTYRVILNDGCTDRPDTAFQTVYVKPPLKVNLTASSNIACINKNIALSTNGSGGDTAGYVFTWNNGLGTGKSKNITLTDTILCKVTLTDGCSVKSSSDSIWLYTYPALKVAVSNDTTICRGTTVNLNSNFSGGLGSGYTFSWNSGENTPAISKTPVAAGWYKMTLNDNCSPSVSDSVYVNLLAPLNLSNVNDTTLCDGQFLPLNMVGTGGRSSTRIITWTPGTISGFTPVLSPSSGTTNYSAVLSDGCTVLNDTTKFKINKLTPLVTNITITPNAICDGDSVRIDIAASGGKTGSLVWSLDGVPVSFNSIKIKPASTHNYVVDLVDGCSVPVNANANLLIHPAASATLSVDPKIICENNQVLFKYSSPDAAKVTWYFSTSDSGNGTGIDYPKVFPGAGNFTAKARVVTTNGCVGNFILADTVKAIAYPKAKFVATPDITNIENPLINFTDASVGATTYTWDFGDGTTSPTAGSTNHLYKDTGWFTVNLRISVAPGCDATTSKMVRIKDVYRFYIPSSFTPDDNGVNDFFMPKGRAFKSFHMVIYNRWGMKMYETNNMNAGWNGKDDKDIFALPGFYAYLVEIIDTEEFRHVEKGSFILLR